jgi:SnoaL-like domain
MTDEQGADQDQANRAIVERFFAASEAGDRSTLTMLMDDDMVMEWPQSGERFRGRDNVLGAMAAVEVKPAFAGTPRLVGSGQVWVLTVPLRYAEDVLHYVAVLELEGGRIRRGTGVWGAPFPAQEARAPFAEKASEAETER